MFGANWSIKKEILGGLNIFNCFIVILGLSIIIITTYRHNHWGIIVTAQRVYAHFLSNSFYRFRQYISGQKVQQRVGNHVREIGGGVWGYRVATRTLFIISLKRPRMRRFFSSQLGFAIIILLLLFFTKIMYIDMIR
ncbi:hypothetical protein F4802DRAFT_313906 [Xylaria palmicola]|nr:hypothetical protein F4802DRAFT_313906 [Xylaria palmicola]